MKQTRKLFEVIIDNKSYDVFNIPFHKHHSFNGECPTWWVYFSDKKLKNGQNLDRNNPCLIPYSVTMERLLWDISFVQVNISKEKWNNINISSKTRCEMKCNGKLIYSFTTTGGPSGLSYAMSKVGYLTVALMEHPFDFLNPEKEKGKKIWWYGLPATIQPYESEGWNIAIHPDYTTGVDKETWWSELKKRQSNFLDKKRDEDEIEEIEEDIRNGYINWGDALSDGHIDWNRI